MARLSSADETIQGTLGRGRLVNPTQEWTPLTALVPASTADATAAISQLAARGAGEVLPLLEQDLEKMIEAHANGDVAGFVRTDLEFLERILEGCVDPEMTPNRIY